MRTYNQTHPWITFALDLRQAPAGLWMLLGEVRSKCEHIAGVPLDEETARQLYQLALTRGVQATTAIEGNTLTEAQVRERIEGSLELPSSQEYMGREVDNIVKACNAIFAELKPGTPVVLSADLISGFNKLVLDGLSLQPNVVPGAVRKHPVWVGSYKGVPAEDCGYLLDRLCTFINEERGKMPGLDAISSAVILAVLAHLYIAWIHPYGDGNGRTARLVEFMILLDAGVPAPAAHLLSNHYNLTRQRYYQELEKVGRPGTNVIPFLEYAIQGLVDGLKRQIEEIRGFQIRMIWRDHVASTLGTREAGDSEAVRSRRRDLVAALSWRVDPVPVSEIPLLTPGIAKAYAARTRKTLSRDLNALSALGLVELAREGARARTETVLAFLPPRKGA